jgi:hypothetical protein
MMEMVCLDESAVSKHLLFMNVTRDFVFRNDFYRHQYKE